LITRGGIRRSKTEKGERGLDWPWTTSTGSNSLVKAVMTFLLH